MNTRFQELPLGQVRPTSWLLDQLRLQVAGFTGLLPDVWPDVGPRSGWLGGDGEDWERGPYYCDGLIPLSRTVGDAALYRLASPWIEWSLGSQRSDGNFGPVTNDDWWPRMVMRARGAENVLSVLWLYQREKDPTLLELTHLILSQTLDWGRHLTEFPCTAKQTAFDHSIHVVNVAMGLKEPALRYLLTGDERHREVVYAGLANLDRWHGQPQGMFSGDEWLAGTDPTQGVELCAVVEFAFTLQHLLRIFGDHRFADRLERVVYNALPATISADMRARQYDQQPNQVLCSVAKRNWTANRDDANVFGLEPDFGCCTANLHQGWPKFARAMWMRSADDGLVATAYGPCSAAVAIDGAAMTIREVTAYPFQDEIRFEIWLSRPTAFPLVLRVPEWCEAAEVWVNGSRQPGFDRPGFHTIRQTWQDGDVVELRLPAPVRLEERPSGGVAVQRGPLTFALRVGEDWREIRRKGPFADWEVHPTTPWNYALAVDRSAPARSFRLERRGTGPLPFAGDRPPLVLHAHGRRVPAWTLADNSAGPLPPSPVLAATPLEPIDLIPYGCARLRVTEMPVTG